MNKKLLTCIILTFVFIGFSQIKTFAHPDFSKSMMHNEIQKGLKPPMMHEHQPPSVEEFENRLNLTEEQKNIAKAQREEGITKIKPILDDIKSKKAEIATLKAAGASVEDITKLDNEIKNLHRKAHEIRRENMKAFEATLNDEQKRELQKMKEEGRKQFRNNQKRIDK